jgi:hypothetical protein
VDWEVPRSALVAFLNGRHERSGLHLWSGKSPQLARELSELGFVEGKNLVKKKFGRVLIFDAEVRGQLGLEPSEPRAQSAETKPPGPDPEDLFEGKPTRADSMRKEVS